MNLLLISRLAGRLNVWIGLCLVTMAVPADLGDCYLPLAHTVIVQEHMDVQLEELRPDMYGGCLTQLVWNNYRYGCPIPTGFSQVHLNIRPIIQFDGGCHTLPRVQLEGPVDLLRIDSDQVPIIWNWETAELARTLVLPDSWSLLPVTPPHYTRTQWMTDSRLRGIQRPS